MATITLNLGTQGINNVRNDILRLRRNINDINTEVAENNRLALQADAATRTQLQTKNRELAAERRLLSVRKEGLNVRSSEISLADRIRRANERAAAASARAVEQSIRRQRAGVRALSRDFSSLAQTIRNSVLAGIFGGAFATRSIVSAAIEVDTFRSTLEALGNSTEIIEQRLQRINELARFPGITRRSARGAFLQLEGLGFTAQRSFNFIQQLGNAIALVGETDLQPAIRALSQIAGSGRVAQEEINQLTERYAIFTRVFTSEFGTTRAEGIRGQLTRGNEEFFERFLSALQRLGRAPETGAANIFSNFQNALNSLATELGNLALPSLTRSIQQLTTQIENNTTGIRNSLETFINALNAGFRTLIDNLNRLPSLLIRGFAAVQGFNISQSFGEFGSVLQDENRNPSTRRTRLGQLVGRGASALGFVGRASSIGIGLSVLTELLPILGLFRDNMSNVAREASNVSTSFQNVTTAAVTFENAVNQFTLGSDNANRLAQARRELRILQSGFQERRGVPLTDFAQSTRDSIRLLEERLTRTPRGRNRILPRFLRESLGIRPTERDVLEESLENQRRILREEIIPLEQRRVELNNTITSLIQQNSQNLQETNRRQARPRATGIPVDPEAGPQRSVDLVFRSLALNRRPIRNIGEDVIGEIDNTLIPSFRDLRIAVDETSRTFRRETPAFRNLRPVRTDRFGRTTGEIQTPGVSPVDEQVIPDLSGTDFNFGSVFNILRNRARLLSFDFEFFSAGLQREGRSFFESISDFPETVRRREIEQERQARQAENDLNRRQRDIRVSPTFQIAQQVGADLLNLPFQSIQNNIRARQQRESVERETIREIQRIRDDETLSVRQQQEEIVEIRREAAREIREINRGLSTDFKDNLRSIALSFAQTLTQIGLQQALQRASLNLASSAPLLAGLGPAGAFVGTGVGIAALISALSSSGSFFHQEANDIQVRSLATEIRRRINENINTSANDFVSNIDQASQQQSIQVPAQTSSGDTIILNVDGAEFFRTFVGRQDRRRRRGQVQ